ncbi:MAG: hypothetical protein J5789_01465, partial [Oscillospiraceae bacterium]|nr:hypothetical protein [Oscillospiraceae bacterium]
LASQARADTLPPASPVLFQMFSNGNLKTPQFFHVFIFSFFHSPPCLPGPQFATNTKKFCAAIQKICAADLVFPADFRYNKKSEV